MRVREILRERALCLVCATREADASQFATMRAITTLPTLTLQGASGRRCNGCGGVGPVYRI